ncbi:MAG: LTA synthase family protein [Salinivirgaceae bacterium]|nr:LTA synthase family protein [Salinivirgaceae bacterium]
MTATRLLFYAMNSSHFCLSFSELVLHLLYGLKFDMVSIALANMLFVVMSVLPFKFISSNIYQKILKIIFLITNSALLACNFVDCKFYEWEEKRLTADIFTPEWMGSDFLTLLPKFFTDYWPLFLAFGLTVFLLVKLYPKLRGEVQNDKITIPVFLLKSVVALLIMAITALASRGSFGEKPLRIMAAAKYTTPERMPLILNSSFTIFKTLGNSTLSQHDYFTEDELEKVYTPLHKPDSAAIGKGKNVVIIILESFGREYSALLNNLETGYTPCLDSLMRQGLYCTNAYANGKRSIEAMPSVMASLPALLDKAFITSTYASNQIDGLATLLRRQGYRSSAFFHGGANGTMSFDSFTSLAGFEHYYGFNEYPDKGDSDNYWGIFDEPFEQFMVNELSTFEQPFVAGLFTLSSHHPYTIPEQHKGRFPKGHLINLESIGYADYALGRFFESASKTDWYNNTLFVLTADHTAQSESEFYQSTVGHYAVPLVFICPSDSNMHGIYTRTAQQIDIMPTILDYVGCDEPFVAFGNSLFDTAAPRYSVSYLNGLYQIIDDERYVVFDGDEFTTSMEIKKLYHNDGINHYANGYQFISISESVKQYQANAEQQLRSHYLQQSENKTDDSNLQLLKGIIQQYNTRMQNNELSAKRNKDLIN